MFCCVGSCQRFVVWRHVNVLLYGVLSTFGCMESYQCFCCMEFCQCFVIGSLVSIFCRESCQCFVVWSLVNALLDTLLLSEATCALQPNNLDWWFGKWRPGYSALCCLADG